MCLVCVHVSVCACAHFTAYACGGVGWDVGVDGDLRVEDAAVRVSVHLQGVQELSVVLNSVVVHTTFLWDQLRSALWGSTRPTQTSHHT